jgi:hypothetical protein
VRVAPNQEMAADWRVSPWGGGGGRRRRRSKTRRGTAMILASEADGPSQGWMGEAAACLSAGLKKRGEKGNGTAAGGC